MKVVLTIAGSDSGGGAGIQADLKTFEAHGVFGTSVITALTAQNTMGVEKVWDVPAEMIEAQLKAIFDDFELGAAKTGMLGNANSILAIARFLSGKQFPLVVDPVMISTSGHGLLQEEALQSLRESLIPLALVLTPNCFEAGILANITVRTETDMLEAARRIGIEYPGLYVLVKGGHLNDEKAQKPSQIRDLIWRDGSHEWVSGPYIDTPHTHGTGCTLSAAIAANLCRGLPVNDAIRQARKYLTGALNQAWSGIGKGRGSLRHNFQSLINP